MPGQGDAEADGLYIYHKGRRLKRWPYVFRTKRGKDTVLKKLEAYHSVLENQQAYLFGDPETVHQASKMTAMLLKQDETMIKLRQMTDEDIKRILEASNERTDDDMPKG